MGERLLWLMDPGEGGGAGGGSAAAAPAANAADSASGGSSAASGAAGAADAGIGGTQAPPPDLSQRLAQAAAQLDPETAPAAGGAQGQSSSQTEWSSFRDAAREYGFDLSQYPDDHSALAALAAEHQRIQQLQQLAQYGQTYLQHADQFQAFIRQQQQQAQQQQQQSAFWNPPEFNVAWERLVTRDPQTGEFKLAVGAPPEILPKYLAYQQYRQDFANRLLSDPEKTLAPMVQQQAEKIAQQIVERHLNHFDEHSYAQRFVEANSGWLHQRDQGGNVVRDPSGKPLLSPEGLAFRNYVVEADRSGIRSLPAQEQYARKMMERDWLAAQYQQTAAVQQNQQTKQAFVQNANRQPNVAGSVPAANFNGNNPPQNGSLDLHQRLEAAMKAAGITDADIRDSAA